MCISHDTRVVRAMIILEKSSHISYGLNTNCHALYYCISPLRRYCKPPSKKTSWPPEAEDDAYLQVLPAGTRP
ncbi:glycoside hydrolase family 5 protein [Moniliophthora roreri]|nr:glycoside hydrolase family 5 protein [Moniliophthora roreri]